MSTYEVIFYSNQGKVKSPVKEFIANAPSADRAKILSCLQSLREQGVTAPKVNCRQIKDKLWEIKISASVGYRIFYIIVHGNTIVLLHGYKKKTQKAPLKELKVATKRMSEVLKNETIYIR